MALIDFKGREKSSGDFLQAKLPRADFTSLVKTSPPQLRIRHELFQCRAPFLLLNHKAAPWPHGRPIDAHIARHGRNVTGRVFDKLNRRTASIEGVVDERRQPDIPMKVVQPLEELLVVVLGAMGVNSPCEPMKGIRHRDRSEGFEPRVRESFQRLCDGRHRHLEVSLMSF